MSANEKWLFDGGDGKDEEAPADRLVVNEAFATRFEQKNRDMRIARLEAEVRESGARDRRAQLTGSRWKRSISRRASSSST